MLDKEIWLESDVYWFDREENTAAKFFDRTESIFKRNPSARKGLSLCVGWLRDSVLYFDGDMKKEIPTCQSPTYKYWDYERLRECVLSLKKEAQRRNIGNFHVVLMFIGGETMYYEAVEKSCVGWSGTEEREQKEYYNIRGKWFPEHPEIDRSKYWVPYLGSNVNTENGSQIFYQYFAEKLIAMTSACALDGTVFRDHFFTPSYIRGNAHRYMSEEAIEENTQTFINFFGLLKKLNPNFITIGYNSGSSTVEELRSHGFDLERLCESGYLDVFIVQTWASAWQDYWPAYSMGYSFQLQYVLAALAFVKDSPCNLIFVTETFDAWEPWDSIHQFNSKVMWEIWAYSHAELKTPKGSVRCSGCYISWLNHGYNLIDEKSLKEIEDMIAYCNESMAKQPVNAGGCIVYDRQATYSNICKNAESEFSCGEEFDDWCAMLQKYGTSIFSITRAEWLDQIDADWFVVSLLSENNADAVLRKADANKMLLFMGRAALLPTKIRNRYALNTTEAVCSPYLQNVVLFDKNFSETVNASGCQTTNVAHTLLSGESLESRMYNNEYAVFAKAVGQDVYFWETPEWGTKLEQHLFSNSFGDVEQFVCIAEELNLHGQRTEGAILRSEDYRKPVNFLHIRYPNGENAAMVANLETGMTGCSQFAVHAKLCGDLRWIPTEQHLPTLLDEKDGGISIALAGHKIGIAHFTIE